MTIDQPDSAGTPLVSVLMPTYNCAKYIGESIESVLRQSYSNWELLVVDDASSDETQTLLKGIDDPRLRVVRNEENLGIAGARNVAISKAKGKYIAWLDSDDLADPERLSAQVGYLEANSACVLCCSDWVVIDGSGNILEDHGFGSTTVPADWELLWSNPVSQSSVMVRREAIIENGLNYETAHSPAEDYNMWCKLAAHGRIHKLPQKLLSYRRLPNSAYHANQRKAMVMSVESNESAIRELTGRYPHFHRHLTAFAWALEGSERPIGLRQTTAWLEEVARKFQERSRCSEKEAAAIQADIRAMKRALIRRRIVDTRSMAGALTIAAYSPALWARLIIDDVAAVARRLARLGPKALRLLSRPR